MTNLFEKFDIHGVSNALETSILASLYLGDPCLIVGKPGSAKTEIIKMIGLALEHRSKAKENNKNIFSWQIYDASKLSPDELVGFPDIEQLRTNKTVSYIPTPLTIWGKQLIGFDEINRANNGIQNSLFEIIRSRKCNGIPTGTKFIYGTMNPYGHSGTMELVGALIDRFTFFLKFPDFEDMSDVDKRKIVQRIGDVDGVGLRFWGNSSFKYDHDTNAVNTVLSEIGEDIVRILSLMDVHYKTLKESFASNLTLLVIRIQEALKAAFKDSPIKVQNEICITGRKSGMIFRAALASRAADFAKAEVLNTTVQPISATLKTVFLNCLPLGISGNTKSEQIALAERTINHTIDSYWELLTRSSNTTVVDTIHTLLTTKDFFQKLSILMSNKSKQIISDDIVIQKVWSSFTETSLPIKDLIMKLKVEIPGLIPDNVDYNSELKNYKQSFTSLSLRPEIADLEEDFKLLSVRCNKYPILSNVFNNSLIYYNSINDSNIAEKALRRIAKIIANTEALITNNSNESFSFDSTDSIENSLDYIL